MTSASWAIGALRPSKLHAAGSHETQRPCDQPGDKPSPSLDGSVLDLTRPEAAVSGNNAPSSHGQVQQRRLSRILGHRGRGAWGRKSWLPAQLCIAEAALILGWRWRLCSP